MIKKRDKLAEERTQLANERTMLSYIRTGLTIIVSGFIILKFFEDMQFMRYLAYISISGGLFLLSATVFIYSQRKKRIRAVLDD